MIGRKLFELEDAHETVLKRFRTEGVEALQEAADDLFDACKRLSSVRFVLDYEGSDRIIDIECVFKRHPTRIFLAGVDEQWPNGVQPEPFTLLYKQLSRPFGVAFLCQLANDAEHAEFFVKRGKKLKREDT